MFTLVAYDHLMTFADELELVWRRKFTVATWLFLTVSAWCYSARMRNVYLTGYRIATTASSLFG
ncbi:hypothetical protein SCHPADRAFT_374927 [Schizopora paradoxa]|uniref:DUF6533 domain-containing protein n=1 Tax=Schizopora paradoxa TaxID=27342 RepID=A0A0H2RNJ5_9AGAM|nr:hypothetical protein SCHPADRAFT_374927 [Schizopora paradoxa]